MSAVDSYPSNTVHFIECYFNQILTLSQHRGKELFGAMTRETLISNSQVFFIIERKFI